MLMVQQRLAGAMAFFVLRHESLDETSLTWFAHYLDDINTGALEIQNLWLPVTVA